MNYKFLQIVFIALTLFSCGNNMSTKEDIKNALGNVTDKDLIPHYKTVYSPDSVELENVELLLNTDSIDQKGCLTVLSNSCKELKADFNNYLLDTYKTLEYTDDRIAFPDIGNISHFIVWKFKFGDTTCFGKIFETAELILNRGSETTQNLIIAGLFEGIQNVGGWHQIDYYKGFDKWLKPKSKKAWDDLIDFWEKEKN